MPKKPCIGCPSMGYKCFLQTNCTAYKRYRAELEQSEFTAYMQAAMTKKLRRVCQGGR